MKEKRKFFGLKDENGKEICEGDIVENSKGQKAEVCLGQHMHHFRDKSSPSFGVYFDGDEGFFFSEHLKENGKVRVRIVEG